MAVPVGGANGLIDRLLSLLDWRATSTTTDQERIDCLNSLDYCEQLIAQSESLLYLETEATLSLITARDYVALPDGSAGTPLIDYGKELILKRPGGEGIIEFRPADKFAAIRISTAYAIGSDPAYYTIVRDHTANERRFKFKPANTSGLTITIPIVFQRIPPTLTDLITTFSTLTDGYEVTLLLPAAEEYVKSRRHDFGIDNLSAALGQQLAEFYNKQRSNKEVAQTDRSRGRRKVDVAQADENK